MQPKLYLYAVLPLLAVSAFAQDVDGEALCLIPQPAHVERGAGSFPITPETPIVSDAAGEATEQYLAGMLSEATGLRLAVAAGAQASDAPGAIGLTTGGADAKLGAEGYTLSITPAGASIQANESGGLFYGAQTLRQLLVKAPDGWVLPCAAISDQPRFGWRGLMMDCSRTFWSVDYLKRYIDLLACYKMNVFHLHLTDDQGWRLEIRGHPRLTEEGARFEPRYNEPPEREGFYTQEQMRDLIRHAAERHVTIVPEIEMPGHSTAFLKVYPDLSCTGGPFEIFPYFQGPGVVEDVICPGNDRVFEVLDDVLTEVVALFPSQYVHIGGDEVPKTRWKACPRCQARMKEEGLESEEELQSWFIKRIDSMLESKGRHLIGWDEILEGGLAPGAAVMSWRGIEGGIAAAKMGHDVVMSPTSHCYFDYANTGYPVRSVYSYEPIPEALSPEQARFILGAQANMWTHIARTEPEVDRQVFPRLLALAEVTWSPKDARNWEDFVRRLLPHCERLQARGVAYSRETEPFAPAGMG